jgi:hypothetical protein
VRRARSKRRAGAAPRVPWGFEGVRIVKVPPGRHRGRVAAALAVLVVAGTSAPVPASAQADTLKITQIEQDLRELRRTVEQHERRLDALDAQPSPGTRPSTASAPRRAAPPTGDERWLQSANWERVRPGLGELDVIAALGAPTSMRTSDDGRRRTLYYALEIGTSGYLGGQVTLEERRVVAVERPRLR